MSGAGPLGVISGWLAIQMRPPTPSSSTAVRTHRVRISSGVRCLTGDLIRRAGGGAEGRVAFRPQATTRLTIFRGTTMTFFTVLPVRNGWAFSAFKAAASISAALAPTGIRITSRSLPLT